VVIKAIKDIKLDKNKIIIGSSSAILIIIFALLYFYQESRLAKHRELLEQLESEIEAKNSEINSVMDRLELQQNRLFSQFVDLSTVISDQIFSDQIGKDFFSFMDNPNGRRIYREQQEALIDETYNDLYDELRLTEDEIDEIRELLIDKQMVNLEIIVSLLKGNLTEELALENEKKFNDMIESAEKNIIDFFEDDELNIYKNYNLTLDYRNYIFDFKTHLSSYELSLDRDQETRLYELIREETENYNFTEDLNSFEFQNKEELSEDDKFRIDRYFDERVELDENVLQKSRGFLDDTQYDELKRFQDIKRNMDEMGFEIMSGSKAELPEE